MNAAQVIYKTAGSPTMTGDTSQHCRTCGFDGIGQPFNEWVKPTFTDWDKIGAGEIICHACQFCFADQNETLAARLGVDKPQRMRNYSHFVLHGEWIPLSKGAKVRMLEVLMQSPEVAVIAEQGQKHIIFRSRHGWWQIEESAHRPFLEALTAALSPVAELYSGGFSKTEIETGRYLQHRIMDFGVTRWANLDNTVRALRGGPALSLALFLVQKDKEDDIAGSGRESPVADMAGDSRQLQDQVRALSVAAIRGQHKKRGLHVESGSLF